MQENNLDGKVVLVTGAARRIGAAIVTRLHENGARVAIHYRGSADAADALAQRLNIVQPQSAATFQADLLDTERLAPLVDDVVAWGGRLDGLVNNASTFYPTPVGTITEDHWTDLMGSNLKAPIFLSQAAVPHLRRHQGHHRQPRRYPRPAPVAQPSGLRPCQSRPCDVDARAGEGPGA